MPIGRLRRFPAVVLVLGIFGMFAVAQEPAPAIQRDEQKKLVERTDTLARRVASAVDVITYQRIAPTAERMMLDQMAAALRDLSGTELRRVLAHLESAAKASDKATTAKELLAGYEERRQVVSRLRAMAARLDVIRNLNDAAAKLDRAAGKQLAIVGVKQTLPLGINLREHVADEQTDLNAEVAAVLKQLGEISRFLAFGEKDRLEKAGAVDRGDKLMAEMTVTLQSIRKDKLGDARERQRQHATELKDIAGAIRGANAIRLMAVEIAQTGLEAALRGGTSRDFMESHVIDPKDRRPSVLFQPETTREPGLKLDVPMGRINPVDFTWNMPLTENGRIQVIYDVRSETGISAVNICYRIIPKGGVSPNEKVPHPRDDRDGTLFSRLPLQEFKMPKESPGAFVRDLGLFEKSRKSNAVELYILPDAKPAREPVITEAGGRMNFEVSALVKRMPDGSMAKLEVGDTVEVYVEVLDRGTSRVAGYTRAKRKTVMTEYEAQSAIVRQMAGRGLADQLRDLADDQVRVFVPKMP